MQHDLVEQVIGFEVCDGVLKLILLKNVPHVLREAVDVVTQVQCQGVRVIGNGAQVVETILNRFSVNIMEKLILVKQLKLMLHD